MSPGRESGRCAPAHSRRLCPPGLMLGVGVGRAQRRACWEQPSWWGAGAFRENFPVGGRVRPAAPGRAGRRHERPAPAQPVSRSHTGSWAEINLGRAALPSPLPGMRAARVTRKFEPELDWTDPGLRELTAGRDGACRCGGARERPCLRGHLTAALQGTAGETEAWPVCSTSRGFCASEVGAQFPSPTSLLPWPPAMLPLYPSGHLFPMPSRGRAVSCLGNPVLDPHSSLSYTEPSSDSRGPGAASCGQLWAGPTSGDSPPGGHCSSESRWEAPAAPAPQQPGLRHMAPANPLLPPQPPEPKETVRGWGPPTHQPRARLWESSVCVHGVPCR